MSVKTEPVRGVGPEAAEVSNGFEAQARRPVSEGEQITSLARTAVETFILQRRVVEAAYAPASTFLSQPSACFVCLKTLGRELRGCIGTVEPEKSTLAEEVITNAIKAATRDPRFKPLSGEELPALRYSVDVLGSLEPTSFEGLDPSVFGVVVTNLSGSRRGLLLPAIETIRTAHQQVSIAARKAGLQPDSPLKFYRFRTQRFSEWM